MLIAHVFRDNVNNKERKKTLKRNNIRKKMSFFFLRIGRIAKKGICTLFRQAGCVSARC